MAKTVTEASQESKKRREEAREIASSRNEIHQEQMADLAKRSESYQRKANINAAVQTAKEAAPALSDKVQKKQQQKAAVDSVSLPETPSQPQQTYQQQQNQVQTDPDKKNALSYLEQQTTGQQTTQQVRELQLKKAQRQADEQLKAAENAQKDNEIFLSDYDEISAMSPQEIQELEAYTTARDQGRSTNPLTELYLQSKRKKAAGSLLEKYGQKRLDELAETYGRARHQQQEQQVQQKAKEDVSSIGGAVTRSVGTVALAPLQGAMSLKGRLDELSNRTGRYSTLESFVPMDAARVYNNTVRSEVAQNMAGDGSNPLRKGAAVLYQAAAGTVSSLANAIVLGPGVGMAVNATNQFAQTVAEASAQGATPEQAYLYATANAAVDALTDKIPLDQLASVALAGNTNVFVNMVKQAGIEVSNEGASILGSYLAEAAILKDSSQYSQSVEAYMDQALTQGMFETEAEARAWAEHQADKDVLAQAEQQLLVAGISGGVSGGIAAVKGNAAQKKLDRQEKAAQAIQAEAERQQLEKTGGQLSMDQVQPQQTPLTPEDVQRQDQAITDTIDQVRDGQLGMEQLPDQPLQNPQQPEAQQPNTVSDIVEQMVRENQAQKMTPEQIQDIAQEAVSGGQGKAEEQSGETSTQPASTQDVANSEPVRPDRPDRKSQKKSIQQPQAAVSPEQAVQDTVQKMVEQKSTQAAQGPDKMVQDVAQSVVQNEAATPKQPTPEQLVQNAAEEATRAARGETVEPVASVGAAEEDFSGHAQYQELLSDDNVQPDRKTDVRLDEVPVRDQNGQKVSEVAKNIMGSRNTPDEGVDQVKDLIQSGVFSFDPKSNEKSLTEAMEDIAKRGDRAVLRQIDQNIGSRRIQEGDIEKAIVLYTRYAAGGEASQADAAQIYADIATMAQISGRNLQMFKLIRSMTPEGQVEAIKRVGDNFLNTHGKTRGKNVEAVIPENLKTQYLEAVRSGDAGRQSDVVEAIYQAIGSQAPASLKEKWDTWRYMCMLGNPKTQVRNLAGNAAMKPFAFVKDKLAAGMETALEKAGVMSKEDRTKSLTTDKDLLEFAKMDAKSEAAQDALKYSAKLGADVTKDKMSENRQIFKSKGLEAARKAVEYFPEAGDMIFKNGYYAKYLANYLTAQGVSIDDIQTGKVSSDVMAKARQYAIDNAYINTFNDSNDFSDAVAKLGKLKNSNSRTIRAFGTAVDAVLPFRRTPANILVRFKEYSPVEIAATAIKAFKHNATAAEICNSLATGLTGTAAMGIGFALAKGMHTKSGDGIRLVSTATDEEKLQGSKDYSIEVTIGGKTTSYSVEWAAPVNMPFFVGANIYNSANVPEEEKGDWADGVIRFIGASQNTLDPMLSLSCLSGLNDLIQDTKYAADNKEVYKILSTMATSYLSQGIPSLFRQAVTASHANKQTTFANDERSEVRGWERVASNIPALGEAMGLKADKIDEWGNTVSAGSAGERVFNSFLNPSTVSQVDKSDPTVNEINRLAKTEFGDGVVPEVASKTLTYMDSSGETHKDVRLTKEQWTDYATTRGQTSKKVLDKLIASKDYQNLTDSGKQAAIKLVYEYADKTGAIKAMKDHDGYPESWMEEAAQSKDPGAYIVGKVSNSAMTNALKTMANAWDHGSERPAQQKELEESYNSFTKQSETIQKAIMDAAEGNTKKYLEGRQSGLSSQKTLSALKSVQSVPAENRGKIGYQLQAISSTKGLSEEDMDAAMKLYMPDYDPSAKNPDVSELRYEYIRKDMGYSAKDYASFRYAYNVADSEYGNDNNSVSKKEFYAAMESQGYSKKEADDIYTVLWGTSNQSKAIKKHIRDLYG